VTCLLFLCFFLDATGPKPLPTPAPRVELSSGTRIEIGGWMLEKGASRQDVLSSKPDVFKLTRMGDDDSWLVRETAHEDHLLAIINFESERLASVSRLWAITDHDDSVELSTHVLDLIERLSTDHGENTRVVVRNIEKDGVTVKQIQLIFGPKRVSLYVLDKVSDDGSHHKEAHLDEAFE
jgi:hypothetical protein